MNSDYFQDTPCYQRRHSSYDVTLAPKWRQRSGSLGLIQVSGFSPGISPMGMQSSRSPATPCFMSPRMAFSTQYSHDSPIQILTSGKGGSGLLGHSSEIRNKLSMRRLSRRCKILLILVFAALGTGLFLNRKMNEYTEQEASVEMCSDDGHDCEEEHVHPGLTERFLEIVSLEKIQAHFHNITKEIKNYAASVADKGETEDEEDGQEESTDEDDSSEPETPSTRRFAKRSQANAQRRTIVIARKPSAEKATPPSAQQPQPSPQRRAQRPQRNAPQGGRNPGQAGRKVKIPPGVNPRRYGL